MKRKRIPWSSLLAAAAICLMLAFIGKAVSAGQPSLPREGDRAKATRTAAPPGSAHDERSEVPAGNLVAGNGIIEPAERETRLAAQVSGVIAKIHVKEGDHVDAGAALVELDRAADEAALVAAEAEITKAKAELARAASGLRREDRDAMAAESEAAKARAGLSETTLGRTELLMKGGAASAAELDRARLGAAADKAAFEAADARRRAAAAGSRGEDVAVARAGVLAATARRDQARKNLERLTVTAPSAGEILQIKLQVGEFYSPSGVDPLIVMGDTRKLRVRMDVDERDIGKVKMGARAFAVADAFRDKKLTGRVSGVARRMGRKNLRTDDPVERIDTKILEVVIDLDPTEHAVVGLRVMSYLEVDPQAGPR